MTLELRKKLFKILLFSAIIIGLFFLFSFYSNQTAQLYNQYIISFLKSYPSLWNIYSHLLEHIMGGTLLGLFYFSILSALFFIGFPVPIELSLFLYAEDYSPLLIILAASLGGLLGQVINYLFGLIFGKKIMYWIFKDKFDSIESKFSGRSGSVLVLLVTLLPFLPTDFISLGIGAIRFPFKKFVLLTLIGKIIKFGLFFIAFYYLFPGFNFPL